MKRNRCKFYAQLTVVGVLATVGLLAISGEPAEDADFLKTFAIQVVVWAMSWLTAAVLYHKWNLGRKVEATDNFFMRKQ